MDIQTLKCDAPNCDHIETVDEITKDHIGKPCPKCGSNLLTASDYRFFAIFRTLLRTIHAIFGKPKLDNADFVNVHHHNGKTTIIKVENDNA